MRPEYILRLFSFMDEILNEFALTFTVWTDVNGWVRCSDGDFRQKKPHNGLVNPTKFADLIAIFRKDHWDHRTVNPMESYYFVKRENMSAEEARNIAKRAWDVIQNDEKLNFMVDWLKAIGHKQPSAVSHGLNMIFDCIGCNIEKFEELTTKQQARNEYYDENH